MKKALLIFMFAFLTVFIHSCKEKACPACEECPECPDCPDCPEVVIPKPWAPGHWDASEVVYNGQVQDSTQADVACLLSQVMDLDSTGTGNWDYTYYDNNTSSCAPENLPIRSWAENKEQMTLFIQVEYQGSRYDLSLQYTDSLHFRLYYDYASQFYLNFAKQ